MNSKMTIEIGERRKCCSLQQGELCQTLDCPRQGPFLEIFRLIHMSNGARNTMHTLLFQKEEIDMDTVVAMRVQMSYTTVGIEQFSYF